MIRNLTPHPIKVVDGDIVETHDPAGPPARLATVDLGTQEDRGTVYELVEFGHVHDLPEPEPHVWLIVSLPVALACLPGRSDLLVPYREVRNDQGTVVGCEMLARPV